MWHTESMGHSLENPDQTNWYSNGHVTKMGNNSLTNHEADHKNHNEPFITQDNTVKTV